MSGVFSGNQWTTPSGSSWNIIIEPDLVNQIAELANHLSVSNKENRPAAEKLVEQAQAASGDNGSKQARSDVVRSLVALVSEKGLYQGVEARDLEGFVNLAAALVNAHLEDNKEVEDSLVQLSTAVSKAASGESSATLSARYSALSSLFNSLPESTSAATRSAILLNLFKLAASSDDLSLLRGAVSALPTWLTSEWNISEGADQYLLTFVEALESASDKEEAGELVRRLLLDYTNANTSDELKSKLLLYTLASSTVFDVEALPVPSTSSSLVQLREIFLTGGLKDLSSVSDLPAPLDQAKLTEKLQYVLLADFASTKVGQDVSYEEVAGALGLQTSGDEEEQAMEVESWIIATIRAKLLTARLHQPSNSVSIIRATPRRFEAEQWKTLQTRLEAWKSSIGNILETVGRAVGPHPSTRGQQTHDAQSLHSAAYQQQQRQQEVVEVV